MKSFSTFIIISLLSFSFSSCGKKNKTYTITGRMMIGCGVPAANKKFSLYQGKNLANKGGPLKDFTCDENGYFSVSYKPQNRQKLEIRDILEDIPVMQNLNLGDVYVSAQANIVIALGVSNPYTSSDTLYYTNYNYPNPSVSTIKIAGPFVSGVLDTLFNVPQRLNAMYGMSGEVSFDMRLNSTDLPFQTKKFKPCEGSYPFFLFKIN